MDYIIVNGKRIVIRGMSVALMLGWFVVTMGGKPVMGPFDFLSDCDKMVRDMTSKGITVSLVCRQFSD